MPKIQVTVPGMLADCVGGRRQVDIEADQLDHLLVHLRREFPLLRPHVWDDAGVLRQHVLIFYNDTATRWLPSPAQPLTAGDRVTIVQAISGG